MVPSEFFSVLGTILGGLIGYLSARLLWQTQMKQQRRNLARAFLLEVRQLKRMLQSYSNAFESLGDKTLIEAPIYGRDGLYYSTQKEICAFSPDLAENLYTFYMSLMEAERARQVKKDNIFFKFHAEAVRVAIVKANKSVPNLERLLAKEAGE